MAIVSSVVATSIKVLIVVRLDLQVRFETILNVELKMMLVLLPLICDFAVHLFLESSHVLLYSQFDLFID